MNNKYIFKFSIYVLLYSSVIFSKNAHSQCVIPNEYQFNESLGLGNTGANMTILLLNSFISNLTYQSNNPYLVVLNSSGLVVGSASVLDDNLINGQTSLSVWGNDTFTNEIDGALGGEELILKFVDGYTVYTLTPTLLFGSGPLTYTTNEAELLNGFEIASTCIFDLYVGCTDSNACNYNPEAISDDGSCELLSGSCDVCFNGFVSVNDEDGDNICDFDEIPGCQDVNACNYNPLATDPPINLENDQNPMACSYDLDSDGVCDIFEVIGCTDYFACNYDANATDEGNCIYAENYFECDGDCISDIDSDGVCDELEIVGCNDSLACNYNFSTTDIDNSQCVFATGCDSCSGEIDGTGILVDNDSDDDGFCDDDEVMGCTDSIACSFSESATEEDNSCLYYDSCGECGGNDNCAVFFEADMTIFVDSILVSDSLSLELFKNNFEDYLETQLGLPEGCIVIVDFIFLSTGDIEMKIFYQVTLTEEEIIEIDLDPNLAPEEIIIEIIEEISVFDDEGIFDYIEFIEGCTNSLACNFNIEANTSDDSCEIIDGICETCEDGIIVDNDFDDDGVCNFNEIVGCTDPQACNYDANPTTDTDNSLCNYSTDLDDCATCSGETDGSGTIIDNDFDDDGVCNSNEIVGCTDALACNYDATSTTDTDNSLCTYSTDLDECATCSGETDGTGTIIDNDFDDDGICNSNEIVGCTDVVACNYNATSTTDTDNSICIYSTDLDECATCSGQSDGTGIIIDNDIDNDGVCNQDEIDGCITISACNYNALATDDDGSCVYAQAQYDCDGECSFDFDNDGVCDLYEVLGCTNSDYLEYDVYATEENGSCQTLIELGCLDDSYLEYDFSANVNDLSLCLTPIVLGCMNSLACNFNIEANTSDDSCEIIDGICETCEDGIIVDNDFDDDGVCNFNEIVGCTDPQACNYDANPTTDTDNSLCNYSTDLDDCATCSGETDGSGTIIDNDFDDDGVCNSNEIVGCTDALACNYDATSTTDTDNSLCTYSTDLDECATCSGETDGTGTIIDNDFDDDGVCDEIDYDDGIGVNELVNVPINIYPNPSKDIININFESNLSNVSVEILNSLGQVLVLQNLEDVSTKYTKQIAVHNLPSGVYLLRVKSDHQLYKLNWMKN